MEHSVEPQDPLFLVGAQPALQITRQPGLIRFQCFKLPDILFPVDVGYHLGYVPDEVFDGTCPERVHPEGFPLFVGCGIQQCQPFLEVLLDRYKSVVAELNIFQGSALRSVEQLLNRQFQSPVDTNLAIELEPVSVLFNADADVGGVNHFGHTQALAFGPVYL
ncbi:MAG: hypothetical protein ACP5E3_13935, partial [Bacteroidales bacterium]